MRRFLAILVFALCFPALSRDLRGVFLFPSGKILVAALDEAGFLVLDRFLPSGEADLGFGDQGRRRLHSAPRYSEFVILAAVPGEDDSFVLAVRSSAKRPGRSFRITQREVSSIQIVQMQADGATEAPLSRHVVAKDEPAALVKALATDPYGGLGILHSGEGNNPDVHCLARWPLDGHPSCHPLTPQILGWKGQGIIRPTDVRLEGQAAWVAAHFIPRGVPGRMWVGERLESLRVARISPEGETLPLPRYLLELQVDEQVLTGSPQVDLKNRRVFWLLGSPENPESGMKLFAADIDSGKGVGELDLQMHFPRAEGATELSIAPLQILRDGSVQVLGRDTRDPKKLVVKEISRDVKVLSVSSVAGVFGKSCARLIRERAWTGE